MEQTKALNALEPFIALTKSATSPRAAADLVTRATSHPGTFIFTELLDTPQIQALGSDSEYAPYLKQLQIFSYGTYALYKSTPGLPPLNDAQALKLRQLSFLSLEPSSSSSSGSSTSDGPASLSYAALQATLNISTPRQLEQVVISAIYAGLLTAILDPQRQVVRISAVAPLRDVAPGAVPHTLRALGASSARLGAALADLDAQMDGVRARARERAAEARTRDALVARLVEKEEAGGVPDLAGGGRGAVSEGLGGGGGAFAGPKKKFGPGGGALRYGKRGGGHLDSKDGPADDEAMDVDDEDDESEEKKRTSRRKL